MGVTFVSVPNAQVAGHANSSTHDRGKRQVDLTRHQLALDERKDQCEGGEDRSNQEDEACQVGGEEQPIEHLERQHGERVDQLGDDRRVHESNAPPPNGCDMDRRGPTPSSSPRRRWAGRAGGSNTRQGRQSRWLSARCPSGRPERRRTTGALPPVPNRLDSPPMSATHPSLAALAAAPTRHPRDRAGRRAVRGDIGEGTVGLRLLLAPADRPADRGGHCSRGPIPTRSRGAGCRGPSTSGSASCSSSSSSTSSATWARSTSTG